MMTQSCQFFIVTTESHVRKDEGLTQSRPFSLGSLEYRVFMEKFDDRLSMDNDVPQQYVHPSSRESRVACSHFLVVSGLTENRPKLRTTTTKGNASTVYSSFPLLDMVDSFYLPVLVLVLMRIVNFYPPFLFVSFPSWGGKKTKKKKKTKIAPRGCWWCNLVSRIFFGVELVALIDWLIDWISCCSLFVYGKNETWCLVKRNREKGWHVWKRDSSMHC